MKLLAPEDDTKAAPFDRVLCRARGAWSRPTHAPSPVAELVAAEPIR
jgi:hypothetical protein